METENVNKTVEVDIETESMQCKYCTEFENKQNKPGLVCIKCIRFVHLHCLRRPGTPGDFACDVFFEFTCLECSCTKEEIFVRKKYQWVNIIIFALNHLHLHSYGISNKGFFHYKTHICFFIDRFWRQLFGPHLKQKKNLVGTIAGALSVYSNMFFQSGLKILGEHGWWRLLHSFSPAVALHISQEMARDKTKNRQKGQLGIDKSSFISRAIELGYKNLLKDDDDISPHGEAEPIKKRCLYAEQPTCDYSIQEYRDSENSRNDFGEDSTEDRMALFLNSNDNNGGDESVFKGFKFQPARHVPSSVQNDSSSIQSPQQSIHDSDSRSSPYPAEVYYDDTEEKVHCEAKKTSDIKPKKMEEKPYIKRESLFSHELNSVELPWEEKPPEPSSDLVEMTEYEEIHLLKQVEGIILKVKDANKKAYLQRFKAKLALRRLKRHKHLPIFDLEKAVKLLSGYMTEDPKVVINCDRILDRFQRSYLLDNLSGTVSTVARGVALVARAPVSAFRSSYSGVVLKPYIRRDNSAPLWLHLTDELLIKTHRQEKDYSPPPHASIDYSYVRPQHIAPVNNLLAQFFWPGIDVTETLEHPEFSCVVTYKQLVIGCAFLVPDVAHNEAYISFVLTRPEWRRAGIGTFMLYHLLQTCMGKDVTLHVSPNNPAMFLYQKFGFKVEELIQDFYEKYYDIDYKGCRHALLLRLVR